MKAKTTASESADQKTLANLLDTIRINGKPLCWCHVPHEGKRPTVNIKGKEVPLYAIELKRKGVKPGVPDNLIFDSPPKFPKIKGLAIELKRSDGGKTTKYQDDWLEALAQRGWAAVVCHGIDECIKTLEYYGYLKGAGK